MIWRGCLFALMGLVATPAWAFVCTQVSDESGAERGPSLSWNTRALSYTFFAEGTQDVENEDEFDVVREGFATWENQQACVKPNNITDLTFSETAQRSNIDRVGWNFQNAADNENLIIFRDDEWPLPGQAGVTIALTTTTYKPLTGEIIDADIEFNTAEFRIATEATLGVSMCDGTERDCECPGATAAKCQQGPTDLLNVTVHEVGHFFGLNHSTSPGSTMLANSSPRDIDKRTPECDDKNAIVFKYPANQPNGYCDPGQNASCTCAPPNTLTRQPTITASNEDDGTGGCNCNATNPGALAFVALWFWARQWATKRRQAV